MGSFRFSGGTVSPRGSLTAKGQQRKGRVWNQGLRRKRKQVLHWPWPCSLQVLPAQVLLECAQVQVWPPLMSPPPHWVSWTDAGASHGLPLCTLWWAPPPGWPHPLPPPEIQELQDTGRSQGLFASLGKSITRACHTSKAEGAARALQRRLSAQGLGSSRREGVHATAGNHLREGLFSHH